MRTTNPKKGTLVNIRDMKIKKDMPEVLSIEAGSFEFAWEKDDFLRCILQPNYVGLVAETKEDKIVVGFMIYKLHGTKIHILNLAVYPNWRRCGIGTQMIENLIAELSAQGQKRIIVEVREKNLPAQLFLRKCGFKATYILRKYYDKTPEDTYLMQYKYRAPSKKIAQLEDLLARIVNGLRALHNKFKT